MDTKFDFELLPLHRDFEASIANFLTPYKGSFSSELNYDLRTIPFEDMERQRQIYAHFLDTIIREAPRSDKSIFLYRGLPDENSLSQHFPAEKELSSISSVFKSMIGECMIFPEFLSTTYNPKIACDFAVSESDYNIVLKFKIPANYPLLALDEALNTLNEFDRRQMLLEGEDEILLPRNSVFRVVSVKKERCLSGNSKEVPKNIYVITLDTSCPQIRPEKMPKLTKKDTAYLNRLFSKGY